MAFFNEDSALTLNACVVRQGKKDTSRHLFMFWWGVIHIFLRSNVTYYLEKKIK